MISGLGCLCALATLAAGPEPFLQLRQATLGYHGPSADFTNLTELRIGWFGPTNLDDPLAGDLWWAANLAVREANAPNDGRETRNAEHHARLSALPIRLVPRWAVDPWGAGVAQLARMVYEEEPLALIGSVDSASTHLAEQVVAKANLPLVSPIATDRSITLAGVSWMFACAPSDTAIAQVLVDGVLATLAGADNSSAQHPTPRIPSSFALLGCTDHESRMTTRAVLRECSRRGRLPDFQLDVPAGAVDASRQMDRLAEFRPAAVLIIAGAEDSARLVRALRASLDRGLAACTLFGSHVMGRTRFLELAGPAANGVCFPRLGAANPTDAGWARFTQRFQAERGRAPDYAAVMTYDATRLLIDAIRQGGPNRARVRDALAQLSPWPGLAGPIEFDGTGQNRRLNVSLDTIRDGTLSQRPSLPSQTPGTQDLSRQ